MIPFVLGLFVILAISLTLRRTTKRLPLPPGPTPLPFVGNLHQLTKTSSRRNTFLQWQKKYGPIFSAKLAGKTIVVLGNQAVARDLLERRGRIYSSRPKTVVLGECMTRGMNTGLLPYGPKWQKHNRILGSLLNAKAVPKYRVLQDVESKQLIHELLSTNDFSRCFYRYSSSLIVTSAYGRRITRGDEPEIRELEKLGRELLTHVAAGTFIVDTFPILNLLPRPFAPWKKIGDRYYKKASELHQALAAAAQKTGSWNWTVQAMAAKESEDMSPLEVAYMIGVLFEAGGNSSKWTLDIFVMACVLHPEAVRRAQRELDEVVGTDRLPTFEDKDRLPYIAAFENEVHRWRPVAAEGVAHSVTEDDEYMGYRIPRGSSVYPNVWSIDMDENIFKDPDTFRPERWIENPDLPVSAFGFGRRLCPGIHFARNSLFIAMSRLLWTYDFDYAYKDGERIEIDPWNLEEANALITLAPFSADLRVRDEHRKGIVEREWRNAEKDSNAILDQVQAAVS